MTYAIETTPAEVIAVLALRRTLGAVGHRPDLWIIFDIMCGALSDRDYNDHYKPLRDVLITPLA